MALAPDHGKPGGEEDQQRAECLCESNRAGVEARRVAMIEQHDADRDTGAIAGEESDPQAPFGGRLALRPAAYTLPESEDQNG